MGVDVSLSLPDEANWDEKLEEKEMSAEEARAWAEKQAAEWVALAEKRRAEWMAVAGEVEKLTSRGWEVSRVVYDVNDDHFRYYRFWHPDIATEEDARAAFKDLGLNPDKDEYSFDEYEDEEDEDEEDEDEDEEDEEDAPVEGDNAIDED